MNQHLLSLLLATALLGACGGKATPPVSTAGENDYALENTSPDGIQRMQPYHFSDTVRTDGHTYVYTLHREASDSLPTVSDDEGNRYADNVYTLTISSGDQIAFQRRFTKQTFASYLSAEFLKKGVLDGMMCDKSLPGLRFAVSVSLPQSDMFEPLLMQVDTHGGIVISRDERGEAEFEDDGDGV